MITDGRFTPTVHEWEALYVLLHRLEHRWLPPAIPDASIYHAYDPLPLEIFLRGIRAASEHAEGRRFLDLGCGIGAKLAFMRALGWEVAGVERQADYVEIARELVPEAEITHGQIEDIDSFDADLVYMYRPAISEELELELEVHVIEHLDRGTLLFIPERVLRMPLPIEQLTPQLWRA